jgi:hypothetical protein
MKSVSSMPQWARAASFRHYGLRVPVRAWRPTLLMQRAAVRGAIAALLAGVAPAVASAQSVVRPGRITGTVWDSTMGHPLALTMVQAVRADSPSVVRVVRADERGVFVVDSLDAATYLVAPTHPRLDSLGIEQLVRRVVVKAGAETRTRLTVPSARTLTERMCGASATRGQLGYARGIIRDAARNRGAARGTVRAEWRELTLGASGVARQSPSVEVDSDEQGAFVLCGVPQGSIVRVTVRTAAAVSGVAELTVPPNGILLRDFYVGVARTERMVIPGARLDDQATDSARLAAPPDSLVDIPVDVLRGDGQLSGTSVTTGGVPLPNALLTVWGTGIDARSSDNGRFRLSGLPTGSYTIEGRAIGYQPMRQTVDIVSGDTTALLLPFVPVVALDTVRIIRSREDRILEEFGYRRRSVGTGRFLGPEELLKLSPMRTSDLFRQMTGLYVVPGSGGDNVLMRGNATGFCQPDIWIDGARVIDTGSLDFTVTVDNVRAVEVYRSAMLTPPQFRTRSNLCGVIVFWTGARR